MSTDTVLSVVPGTGHDRAQPDARVAARIRRRELAAFLRSRRERLSPEQVGLPPGGRRRTPGLRRAPADEETADRLRALAELG